MCHGGQKMGGNIREHRGNITRTAWEPREHHWNEVLVLEGTAAFITGTSPEHHGNDGNITWLWRDPMFP